MRTITVGSRKGGVTKSTTTVNTAYEIARTGKRVLVVDLDSQANASNFLRPGRTPYFIGDALMDRKFDVRQAIYPAIVKGVEQDNLHVLMGRDGDVMSKLEMDMMSLQRREERLSIHLQSIQEEYDFVFIDTAPASLVLLMNAVYASEEFIIPVDFTENGLGGAESILQHIQDVKFIEEDEINYIILPSKINKIARNSLKYGLEFCKIRFPDNTADTIIWDHPGAFRDAEYRHLPVSVAKPASEAAMFYKRFAKEIINNVA
jgi:chromosome partitioning protein